MNTQTLQATRNASLRGERFPCRCNYSGPQWVGANGRPLPRCAHCGGLLPTRVSAPAMVVGRAA